ncbi:MAG TPA: SIMPL domain-containing protein [Jatrophihabitantaceae bacterium]|jgi:hypothetical protein
MSEVAVHATAHRDVTPDSFDAVVRLVCRAGDAAAAMTALIAGFARVEEAIEALPTASDVTVSRSGVSQRKVVAWRPDGPGVPEWIASRQITLTGRDIEQAGQIIAPFAALTDTVDGLELDGPTWRLDRDNPVHAELQAEAVHEARARAERYAAALGGRLGALIELADPGMGYPRQRGDIAVAKVSYQSQPGEGFETMDFTPVPIEVEAGVQARWALILP